MDRFGSFRKIWAALGAAMVMESGAMAAVVENPVGGNDRLPPIDRHIPVRLETATFALGWFWGPDSRFGSLEGIVRTRVGYTGGSTDHPSYASLGDHSETIEIDFDPARIGYDRLLDIFWKGHDPLSMSSSRQYKAAIFYHGEEQRRLAKASKKHIEEKSGRRVVTEIVPASAFHLAEGYHQKYMLQGNPGIADELRVYYPDDARFTASTAAARLNGYLGGHGTLKQLKSEIESLGLSPRSSRMLWEIVRKRDTARGNRDAESMACPVR